VVEDKVAVDAAILAGGRSSRMGTHKALIELEGKPLIAWVAEKLEAAGVFGRIFVVSGDAGLVDRVELEFALDLLHGRGPLGGLHAALHFTGAEYLFLIACDMPLANPKLIRVVVERSKGVDVCIPYVNGNFEPLFAVYRRNTVRAVERALEGGQRRVISFFPDVRVRRLGDTTIRSVDPELVSFLNINSQDDIQRAEAIIARSRGADR